MRIFNSMRPIKTTKTGVLKRSSFNDQLIIILIFPVNCWANNIVEMNVERGMRVFIAVIKIKFGAIYE